MPPWVGDGLEDRNAWTAASQPRAIADRARELVLQGSQLVEVETDTQPCGMAGKFQVAGEIRQLLYFCWQYSRLRHVLLAAAGLIGRDGRAANRALPGFPGGTDARGGVRSLFLGLPGRSIFRPQPCTWSARRRITGQGSPSHGAVNLQRG